MKIDRQVKNPELFDFAKKKLPPSLVARRQTDGYGFEYCIYQRDHVPLLLRGDPVAVISREIIHLFHHNYFSDMESLALAYEKETGHEITIRYSQHPKEKPLG